MVLQTVTTDAVIVSVHSAVKTYKVNTGTHRGLERQRSDGLDPECKPCSTRGRSTYGHLLEMTTWSLEVSSKWLAVTMRQQVQERPWSVPGEGLQQTTFILGPLCELIFSFINMKREPGEF